MLKRILYLVISYIGFIIINFLLLKLRMYNVELMIMCIVSIAGNILLYIFMFNIKELKRIINIITLFSGLVLSLLSIVSAVIIDFMIIMNNF